jgi:hypothetical protein
MTIAEKVVFAVIGVCLVVQCAALTLLIWRML